MTSPLSNAARVTAELRERLKAEYELSDGDEALETTLDGATELPEMLAKVARDIRETEAMSEAIGKMQKEMAARCARLESKATRLRIQMAWALEEAGMNRIPDSVLPELTVTMGDGREPLIIPDEDKVPREFCRVKYEPDKTKIREFVIKARLGAGAWAYLGNKKRVLTIKTT